MQFYAKNGYPLRVNYNLGFYKKSETRLKKDITYNEHKKRKQEEINNSPYNQMRVQINSSRSNKKPFLHFDKFKEIVESVDLQGKKLYNFLIQYDLNKSLDNNIDELIS